MPVSQKTRTRGRGERLIRLLSTGGYSLLRHGEDNRRISGVERAVASGGYSLLRRKPGRAAMSAR